MDGGHRRVREVVPRAAPAGIPNSSNSQTSGHYQALADIVDAALAMLGAAGFSVTVGFRIFDTVHEFVVGFVRREQCLDAEAAAGRPFVAELHRVLSQRRPEELLHLRELAAALPPPDHDRRFEDELSVVIAGLAQHFPRGRRDRRRAPKSSS